MVAFPEDINPLWILTIADYIAGKKLDIKAVRPEWNGIDSNSLKSIKTGNVDFLMSQVSMITRSVFTTWGKFSLKHINPSYDLNFTAFNVIAALYPAYNELTVRDFSFLTLADKPNQKIVLNCSTIIPSPETTLKDLIEFDDEDNRLALAFRRKMIQEVNEVNHPFTGAYLLDKVPLDLIDSTIVYQQLRLVFVPSGICVSVIDEGQYVTFFWSPSGFNTSQIWFPLSTAFGFDVMLACLWRDAHILREKWATARPKTSHSQPKKSGQVDQQGRVTLPRVIYQGDWKSGLADKSDGNVVRPHPVRGSYRYIGDHFPDLAAILRARDYDYADPPEGFTFVSPYKRGGTSVSSGEVKIVWTGRDIAQMLLRKNRS